MSNSPFPIAPQTWAGFAERLAAAHADQRDEIIACHCQATGFCLAAHVAAGQPFFWELVGPVTEQQANDWATGLDNVGGEPVGLLM